MSQHQGTALGFINVGKVAALLFCCQSVKLHTVNGEVEEVKTSGRQGQKVQKWPISFEQKQPS